MLIKSLSQKIDNFCFKLSILTKFIIFLSMATMIILITGQILGRYFFGFSILWMTEVVNFSLGVIALGGSSVLIYSNEHISFKFIRRRMPPKIQLFVSSIGYLILTYYFILFIRYGYNFAIMGKNILSSSEIFELYHLRLMIPVGSCFLLVQTLNALIKDVLRLFNIREDNIIKKRKNDFKI